GGGDVCQGCRCAPPPPCTSGISIDAPRLVFRASSFLLRAQGEAVIPEPWSAIDPAANGIRIVIDEHDGGSRYDVVLPGGPAWQTKGARGTSRDRRGSVGGISRVVVDDRRDHAPGTIRWTVRGRSAARTLPPASDVRWSMLLGGPGECAAITW